MLHLTLHFYIYFGNLIPYVTLMNHTPLYINILHIPQM